MSWPEDDPLCAREYCGHKRSDHSIEQPYECNNAVVGWSGFHKSEMDCTCDCESFTHIPKRIGER